MGTKLEKLKQDKDKETIEANERKQREMKEQKQKLELTPDLKDLLGEAMKMYEQKVAIRNDKELRIRKLKEVYKLEDVGKSRKVRYSFAENQKARIPVGRSLSVEDPKEEDSVPNRSRAGTHGETQGLGVIDIQPKVEAPVARKHKRVASAGELPEFPIFDTKEEEKCIDEDLGLKKSLTLHDKEIQKNYEVDLWKQKKELRALQ